MFLGRTPNYLKAPISLQEGERCVVKYVIDESNIGSGKYTLNLAVHKEDTHVDECYQWVDVIRTFQVIDGNDFRFIGFSRLKPKIKLEFK